MKDSVAKRLSYPARVVISRAVFVFRGDATPRGPVIKVRLPVGTTETAREYRHAQKTLGIQAKLIVRFDHEPAGTHDAVDVRLLEPLP